MKLETKKGSDIVKEIATIKYQFLEPQSLLEKRWVSVESLKDYISLLASTPHYNPDDAVQQFMLDIKKELMKYKTLKNKSKKD